MPEIISSLTETSTQWAKHIAPVAEWVARTLWTSAKRKANTSEQTPPTRLTRAKKYQVKGAVPPVPSAPVSRVERVCEKCGKAPSRRGRHCLECARSTWRDEMNRINHKGRILANTPEANAKRVEKQAKQWAARWAWRPEMQPAWLTKDFYNTEIQPKIAAVEVPKIARALGVSEAYAADIRAGRHRPHLRHWEPLAQLVGVSGSDNPF